MFCQSTYVRSSLFLVVTFVSLAAVPCTTIFLSGSHERAVAKNMDWPYGQGLALVNKRHIQKRAIFVDSQNALRWISRYMSLTFTQSGREFPWEGFNEAGLSVSVMFLGETVLPASNSSQPAVNGLQWIQYILDTSSSVAEAVQHARGVRIEGHMAATEHYMVCDAHSECAVFENIKGTLVVHQGSDLPYLALANNTYEDSVSYLKKLLLGESPNVILAGHRYGSLDRFARGALLSKLYSSYKIKAGDRPQSDIDYAFKALANVSEPAGTPWPTQWSFVFSLAPRVVHFRTAQSSGIKFARLLSFNPSCKSGAAMFNMNAAVSSSANSAGLVDVSAAFVPYSSEVNRRLVEMSKDIQASAKPVIAEYVNLNTRCLE